MRRALSMLLMVVLVLRGLMGTAMAAGVIPPALPQAGGTHSSHLHAQTATADGSHAQQEKHEHHGHVGHGQHAAVTPMHATACDKSSGGDCGSPGHHAETCSACEICHSAMLDVPNVWTTPLQPPGPLRALTSALFHSALAALAIKPPIA